MTGKQFLSRILMKGRPSKKRLNPSKHNENTSWLVFCIVAESGFLPQRSKARFCAVSLDAFDFLTYHGSKLIKAPSFAPIIEDFCRVFRNPHVIEATCMTHCVPFFHNMVRLRGEGDGEGGGIDGDGEKEKFDKNLNHVKVMVDTWHLLDYSRTLKTTVITQCQAYRLKKMMYRALEGNSSCRLQSSLFTSVHPIYIKLFDFFLHIDVKKHKESFSFRT